MARIKITVLLDVDLAEFGAEYGQKMPAAEVREHIRSDLAEALQAAPYAEAIKKSTVK